MNLKKILAVAENFSLPLVFGIAFALLWANLNPSAYFAFWHQELFLGIDAHFLVNDIFMAFFFAMAGVDIVKSISPGGELSSARKAITPILATIGGLVGPVAVFFTLNLLFGSETYTRGWAIPTATDIAVSLFFARLIFGAAHPALAFLTLLVVADDAIGLAIIAIFYPDLAQPVDPTWLLLVLAALLTAFVMRRFLQVKSYWPYLLVPGVMSWSGLFNAHLHPALALIFIVPFLPQHYLNAQVESKSSLHAFEENFKYVIVFGLFFFGLANAGVKFEPVSKLSMIVFFSLLLGKTAGIFLMSKTAVALGYDLPEGLGSKEVLVLGMVCSVGLTVALFVSNQAYADLALQNFAKMGALLSTGGCFLALAMSKLFKVKKIYASN